VAEIALDSVRFDYPGGVQVFREPGLSLALPRAAIALIGENGAGKTTLTKLLNGLLRPRAGSVTVAGVQVAERSVAQMAALIGYAFQNPDDQLFERTVRDEVAFGPRAMGRHGETVLPAVERALDRCGLSAQASTHPHDLALAERKWVTIASALAADPPVLVLDEPTLGQDRKGRSRLLDLVRSLAAEGRLVLIVTHDIDFVAEACEWTVILTGGRVRYTGPTAQAFAPEERIAEAGLDLPATTRLGRALAADPAPVGEEAFAAWYRARSS
jgi:energy-coupling factor transporter ATP-binding protein EcfA2